MATEAPAATDNLDFQDNDYLTTIAALEKEDPAAALKLRAAHAKKGLDAKLEDNALSGVVQRDAQLESVKMSKIVNE